MESTFTDFGVRLAPARGIQNHIETVHSTTLGFENANLF